MPTPSIQRRTVSFAGLVQGVGFRFTTERLARGTGLTGYVRNRDDGRVELVAEGDAEPIDRLIEGLRRHFGEGIESIESQTGPAEGGMTDFVIRR